MFTKINQNIIFLKKISKSQNILIKIQIIMQVFDAKDTVPVNGIPIEKRKMFTNNKKDNKLQYGINLQLEHSFGCYQEAIQKNAFFTNDDWIIYLCGNHIVQYDIITKKQTFIMKDIEDESVMSMCNYYNSKKDDLYIAVGLKSKSQILPQVKVYKNKKSQSHVLVHSHVQPGNQVIDIQFILKREYLVSLTKNEQNQSQLSVFKLKTDKLMSYNNFDEKENIYRLEVGNKQENQFLSIGQHSLKVWNYEAQDTMLDTTQNLYDQLNVEIVDAVLLDDFPYVIAGTKNNKLHIFKNFKLIRSQNIELVSTETYGSPFAKKQINTPEESKYLENLLENTALSCMSKTSSGVILGFSGQGMVGVYELEKGDILSHKGNYYIQSTEPISKIHCIDAAEDDMFAILTVQYEPIQPGESLNKTVQKYTTINKNKETSPDDQSGKIELIVFDIGQIHALKSISKYPFDQLFDKGVHKGTITHLAISQWHTTFVSLCQDQYIKFWEYPSQNPNPNNEYRALISHHFNQPPICIDIHPNNVQCAIGFKDSLKFYYVCHDSLKNVFTVNQKLCGALSYSSGGQFLAVANFNTIQIYNPYNFEVIHSLAGHQLQINKLEWVDVDYISENAVSSFIQQILVSTTISGQLYTWNVYVNDKETENDVPYIKEVEHPAPSKGFKYNAVVYDNTFDRIVAACDDMKLRIYPKVNQTKYSKKDLLTIDINLEAELDRYFEYDTSPIQFTCIYICSVYRSIIFGTSNGSVRIYFWPFFQKSAKQIEFIEIPIHQAPVTNIQITPDDRYMITTSSDNAIFVNKIKNYWNGVEQTNDTLDIENNENDQDQLTYFLLQDLNLGSYISQEHQLEQIKELQQKVQNFTSDIEDEKERRQDIFGQKLDTLQEKNRDSKNKQRETLAVIFNQHETQYNEIKQKLGNIKHESKRKTEIMNAENAKALLKCYKINDQLNTQLQILKEKYANQLQDSKKQYNITLKKVDEEYQDKYRELNEKYLEALNNVSSDERKFKEVGKQSDDDNNNYLQRTSNELRKKKQEQLLITDQLRAEISQKNKQKQSLEEREVFLTTLIKDTKNENENLKVERDNFHSKKKLMLKQLQEKEEFINQKEQQIKDFRSKNVHLQNFQKVYDYRMSTLQEERQPLIEHLGNMDKHVKNLYKELLEEAGQNKQFDLDHQSGTQNKNDLKQKLKQKNNLVQETRTMIDVFKSKITQLLKFTEFKNWEKQMKEIYSQTFIEKQDRLEKIVESSIIGSNLKQKDPMLVNMEKITQQEIGVNLKGQKEFLSKKLGTVTSDFHLEIEDRNNAYLRVQNMNTLLINECNKLREQKSKLKEYLGIQNKALREVERELESYKREYKQYEEDQEEDIIDIMESNEQKQDLSDRQLSKNSQRDTTKRPKPLPYQSYVQKKQFSVTLSNFPKTTQSLKKPTQENKQNQIKELLSQIQEINSSKIDNSDGNQNYQASIDQSIREKVKKFLYKSDSQKDKLMPLFQKDELRSQSQSNFMPMIQTSQLGGSRSSKNGGNQFGGVVLETRGSKIGKDNISNPPNSRSTKLTTQTNFNQGMFNTRSNFNQSRGQNNNKEGSRGGLFGSTIGSQFNKTGNTFRKKTPY